MKIHDPAIPTLFDNILIPDFHSGKLIPADIVMDKMKIREVLSPGSVNRDSFAGDVIRNNVHRQLILSPGFINVHSHGDLLIRNLCPPPWPTAARPGPAQGVLSEVTGNCGLSASPLPDRNRGMQWLQRYSAIWGDPIESAPDKLPYIDSSATLAKNTSGTDSQIRDSYFNGNDTVNGIRMGCLAGHSTLRFALWGWRTSILDNHELIILENALLQQMDAGATGISMGLCYQPGCNCDIRELSMVCRAVASRNKILAIHIRDESDLLLESLNELLEANESARCRVQLSHLKCNGPANWYKIDKVLQWLEKASELFDISFDIYPYDAGSTTIQTLLPPEYLNSIHSIDLSWAPGIREAIASGRPGWENFPATVGWDRLIPTGFPEDFPTEMQGLSIAEMAELKGVDPVVLLLELLLRTDSDKKNGLNMGIILKAQSIEVVKTLMAHPLSMIGSDGLISSRPHPRTFGTFPRFLGRHTDLPSGDGTLKLVDALDRITRRAAQRFGFSGLGEIRPGFEARLVLFDALKIMDTATFSCPETAPDGIMGIWAPGLQIH
ncbi:MAG: hypothetical protein CVV64_13115 [Candidatus Wallbacteria bacterium HGW-Wallbacteria-1]|uniref:Amidohydrolase 3 domain-containing protein n=1 Tax=Candidatus Wallbacteria bacterium HGW-Wallbacteria-1 TaxID=2013854 RepID=A0A2N1PN19_9BACT|nr:MAG: hypothetical protein CVV64_13115 [Candidatus Wallbacteria bacterium HGW-Wallbacteria-1]